METFQQPTPSSVPVPCFSRKTMTEKEAAAYTGFSIRTLQAWRFQCRGPVYLKVGRSVRYRLADLDTYMNAMPITPTVA